MRLCFSLGPRPRDLLPLGLLPEQSSEDPVPVGAGKMVLFTPPTSHPIPGGVTLAHTPLSRLGCTYSFPALLVSGRGFGAPSRILWAQGLILGLVPTTRALAQLQDGGQVALLGGSLA